MTIDKEFAMNENEMNNTPELTSAISEHGRGSGFLGEKAKKIAASIAALAVGVSGLIAYRAVNSGESSHGDDRTASSIMENPSDSPNPPKADITDTEAKSTTDYKAEGGYGPGDMNLADATRVGVAPENEFVTRDLDCRYGYYLPVNLGNEEQDYEKHLDRAVEKLLEILKASPTPDTLYDLYPIISPPEEQIPPSGTGALNVNTGDGTELTIGFAPGALSKEIGSYKDPREAADELAEQIEKGIEKSRVTGFHIKVKPSVIRVSVDGQQKNTETDEQNNLPLVHVCYPGMTVGVDIENGKISASGQSPLDTASADSVILYVTQGQTTQGQE